MLRISEKSIVATPLTGAWANKTLTVKLDVCASPTCRCADVVLSVFDGADPVGGCLVNIFENEVCASSDKVSHPMPVEEAKAFVGEFTDDDWRFLRDRYFVAKREATASLDPKAVEVRFPQAEIETSGEMVPYHEILPYGDDLTVEGADESFLLDDQYCLRSDCDCTETYLTFIALKDGNAKEGEHHCVRLDYRTGKFEIQVAGTTSQMTPAEVMDAFRKKYPDFRDRIARRRAQLAALYGEYRKRHPLRPSITRSQKAGRNDPCPCGSGKKHKKCCGR